LRLIVLTLSRPAAFIQTTDGLFDGAKTAFRNANISRKILGSLLRPSKKTLTLIGAPEKFALP
jgi:hypothetical protein